MFVRRQETHKKKDRQAEINAGPDRTHNESIDCTGNWPQPQCDTGQDAADWRISSARWVAAVQADWTQEANDWHQDGEVGQHVQRNQQNQANNQRLFSPSGARRFVVSVLDYQKSPLTIWVISSSARWGSFR